MANLLMVLQAPIMTGSKPISRISASARATTALSSPQIGAATFSVRAANSGSFCQLIALNARTSLNALFSNLVTTLAEQGVSYPLAPSYRDFRAGDVRHSQADISKAHRLLGYVPSHTIIQGLQAAMPWYLEFCSKSQARPI